MVYSNRAEFERGWQQPVHEDHQRILADGGRVSISTTAQRPTAPGFIGVGPSRGYSQSNGYGFSDAVTNFTPFTAVGGGEHAGISSTYAPMYEDGIVSLENSPQDFSVSTTVGTTYDLRVYVGNPNVSLSDIQVTVYTGSITNLQQTQIGQTQDFHDRRR